MGKLPSLPITVITFLIYSSGVNALLELRFVGSTKTVGNETCSVKLVEPGIIKTLQKVLTDSDHMVFFEFSINDQTSWDLDTKSEIFQPLKWVRVRGKRGEGLLWLRDEFGMLSLSTLNFGIDRLQIKLESSPTSCLKTQSIQNISLFFRDILMNDLNWERDNTLGADWKPNEKLCNKRMRSNNGYTELFYYCCSVDESGGVDCFETERSIYVHVLLGCIIFLNICVIMFAPLLVPERLYRAKLGFLDYEHALKTKLSLRVMKTSKRPNQNAPNAIKNSDLSEMPNLANVLVTLKENTAYRLLIDKLYFKVKIDKLIPQHYVPVGIIKNLFENFILCKIKEKPAVKGCCTSNIFGSCVYKIEWYKVLREVMIGLFVFSILGSPWGLRLLMFYCYEEENTERLLSAASNRGLRVAFFGNLTILLTPVHAVFIVCYVLILLNGLLFVLLRKTITEKFKFTLRKSFRDMRAQTNLEKVGWATSVLLKPFEKFGIFGLFAVPFYWAICIPFVLCILLFYCFPTVNITLRLFVGLIVHFRPKRGVGHRTHRKPPKLLNDILEIEELVDNKSDDQPEILTLAHNLLYFAIVLMSLASIYAIIFIVMECFSFLVEVFVYTLVGVILNAGILLKYVSLVVMLLVYVADTLNSVNKRYLEFNKAILSAVKNKVKDDLERVSLQTDYSQKNTAFQVESEITTANNTPDSIDREDAHPVKLVVHNGGLKWRVDRFLLFLDNKDISFIPAKFFFDASYMPCVGCPGPLLKNLMNATVSLLKILMFLLFVAVVVGAFGDNLSSTNQTIATIVGSLLPFVFYKFLFKSVPSPRLEVSNLNFQANFKNVIHSFRQSWPLLDLVVSSADIALSNEEVNTTNESEVTSRNSTNLEEENDQNFDLIVYTGPRNAEVV